MIDLEDFSPFLRVKREEEVEQLEGKRDSEEIEARYREELLKLQERYKRELERVKEEAYRKGFQEGMERARSEMETQMRASLEEMEKRYREKLSGLKKNLDLLISQIEEKGNSAVSRFLSSVSDSLIEVLEFLYLSPENAPFVKRSLEELLSTFSAEELISVEVGRELGELLTGENVKVNEELGECDFRLTFKEFVLESRLKEKLKLLREELEREIKKLT